MSRPWGRAAGAAFLLVAVAAAAGLWVAASGDGRDEPRQIAAGVLSRLPDIAFAWAPDDWATSTATGDLYVVRGDGSRLRRLRAWPKRLVDSGYGLNDVHWSPDGRQIAVLLWSYSCADPCSVVAVGSPDGRRLQRRTAAGFVDVTSDGDSWPIEWSPNGRKILFGRPGTVWVMDADGGRKTRLPVYRSGWSLITPDWRG